MGARRPDACAAPGEVTRVGAIDIGTNSTRLLVADVDDGSATELDRRTTITRLGEGVDAGRRLLPEPIARVHRVLDAYKRVLDELQVERTLAVATSAVRDASNGEAFLVELEARYGFPARVVSGEEEAELTRRGVGATDPRTLVVDVGGGSTELIAGDFHTSLDFGSVRLTERFLHHDPPTRSERDAAAAFVRDLLPELAVDTAIGVAGTVTQLHELVGALRRSSVEALLDRLAVMTTAARAAIPGMDPARAPVIVGGAIVVSELLSAYGLDQLAWSVHDLLDGVALEAAAFE
jgi:exopolyphosphatase/guanosine-5'-triphosphate,3'-diphosphate pyrophosphatase